MSGRLTILATVVILLFAALIVAAVAFIRSQFTPKFSTAATAHVPAPPPPPANFEVLVAGAFPDVLRSHGGTAICTPGGEIFAWCGHRNSAAGTSQLIYLHPPETLVRALTCRGVGPDGFEYASSAFDVEAGTLYIFGGYVAAAGTSSDELFRIHLADPAPAWEKVKVEGVKPAPRNGAPMVFDALRRRLIVCSGDGGTGRTFAPLADCWQFDLATATWARLPPTGQPLARWHAAMTLDPTTRKVYLFGGESNGPFDATLYELDLANDTWSPLETTGSPPPSLQGASLDFDANNHVLVLAGGLRELAPGAATLSQVWVYDPATGQWDESDGGEQTRRRDHIGVYDPATGEHILLGGRVSNLVGNFFDSGSPVANNVRLKVRRVGAPPKSQPINASSY